jgi:hypothetical protein
LPQLIWLHSDLVPRKPSSHWVFLPNHLDDYDLKTH